MKKQDIEKNRDELFEAIPKLRNVYKKAFNYIFIIKLIFATILPIISLTLIVLFLYKNKVDTIVFVVLIITHLFPIWTSVGALMSFIFDFVLYERKNRDIRKGLRIRMIRNWKQYYDDILLPLYEMNEKKLAIESLAEAGLLFTKNINFNKMRFIDYVSIGMEIQNKRNWILIFLPIWLFLGGEKYRKSRSYFRADLSIQVTNCFQYDYSFSIGSFPYTVEFLSKETEVKLLKYIKDNKNKKKA